MKPFLLCSVVFVLACGSRGNTFDGGEPDGGLEDSGDCDPITGCFGDDGASGDGAGQCENLECQIVSCGTTNGTTLSGTVYDPAGQRGLYNVFVYVPNRALDAIPDGPVCSQCQAPASGKPIASATTDAKGKFTIPNVPAGTNIPLVMQLGKWRRQITVPSVPQCVDTALTNKDQTRLPKSSKEGNIPKMAFATGCDMAECFLRNRIGIADSEFTGPMGSGRVHVYRGHDIVQGLPASPGDAYALWGNLQQMKKYDIVFNACECSPDKRDTQGNAYANMKSYLEAGGRVFGTHYHYNWFTTTPPCSSFENCNGPQDFASVASWRQLSNAAVPPFHVDTTHPRGKAFADWLLNVGASQQLGQLNLVDTRRDVGTHDPKKSTRWIYGGPASGAYDTYYLSFNAPVGLAPEKQCGRAVFSDVHLVDSYSSYQSPWPQSCSGMQYTDHSTNEIALEFLFFDLSSCVQDDMSKPINPPPN